MSTEIEIENITADGPIEKGTWFGRPAWYVPVVYHLTGGLTQHARDRYDRKKDAVAFQTTLPTAPRWPTRAIYDGDKYIGISVTIGVRRS